MAEKTYYRRGKKLLTLIGVIFLTAVGLKGSIPLVKNQKDWLKEIQVKFGQTITRSVSGIKEPINILLIGNNARDAANPLSLGSTAGEADTLIVAHVDPDSSKVSLISIPRDTLVAMPDFKEPIPKIKSSFQLGLQQSPVEGPKQAMRYVARLTGLKINYYIVTDFQGFADAINAVGGIQVDIRERLYDPEHSEANFRPGLQTLNGEQALAFIRIRQNIAGNNYRTDDFQRQDGELQILNSLKAKLLKSGVNLSKIEKLEQTWQNDVATNIPTPMLIGLGLEASGSSVDLVRLGTVKDSMDITSTPLKGINLEGYLSGAYYDVLDPQNISKTLKPYGSSGASTGLPPLPAPSTVNVDVYGSQAIVEVLRSAKFDATWIGPDYGQTGVQIYYPEGQLMAALSIARVLGTGNELVSPFQTSTQSAITVVSS